MLHQPELFVVYTPPQSVRTVLANDTPQLHWSYHLLAVPLAQNLLAVPLGHYLLASSLAYQGGVHTACVATLPRCWNKHPGTTTLLTASSQLTRHRSR